MPGVGNNPASHPLDEGGVSAVQHYPVVSWPTAYSQILFVGYRIGYDGSLTRQRVSATLARASTSTAISSSTRVPGLAPAGGPGVPAGVVTGSRPAARIDTGRDIGTDRLTPSSSW